ncbi:MAG TPA: efflux RND transporter periplasmic adaptor subunit [Bryobacteraceae bacterium]|jgi:multidrug efflux pump subunit AcrA (membrane-fusion protein)|nr:efflux RND transporter periplasmic adaptor subunit [Bryobacteraceae bacterium]
MRRTSSLTWLIALYLLALSGCSKKADEADNAAPEAAPVQVEPVRQESIRRVVEADGVLYPLDQSGTMPKISAPVQKFYVNRGDHVKAGQLLATLESRDLSAAVAESKGQLDQAESNFRATSSATIPEQVIKAQTDVQSAQQTLDAAQKLLANRQKLLEQGALARKLVDDAQVAYAQASAQFASAQEHLRVLQSVGKEEQVKGAQAQVEAARGHYQSSQAQLGYSEVRAPIGGVIADRPLYAGEMANPGTPLMTVMDISRVIARANVPQNQAGALKVGASATLTQTDTSLAVQGKVTVVSPATDPSSTTVQVWVQADNPGERLKPGTGVHVAIVAATIPNAVVVPTAALLSGEEGGTIVLVVTADNIVHQRKVEVGVREADKVQIISGVTPGEQVVVVGGVGLDDKAKVKIVKPGEAEKPDKDDKDEKGGKSDKGDKDDK